MDVREKLVEILKQAPFEGKVLDEWWFEEKIKRIADHLISNGVTVQEWIPASDPPKKITKYKLLSQLLIVALIVIAAVVAFILATGKSAWILIIVYWVVLTIKNIVDLIVFWKNK